MRKFLATCLFGAAFAATSLPASAYDVSGYASVHVDAGYVVVCWNEKGRCYSFGAARACPYDSRYGSIDDARWFVETRTQGELFAQMLDCGAPLGGAYAGILCLDLEEDPDDHCFNVQENKSLRMELDY